MKSKTSRAILIVAFLTFTMLIPQSYLLRNTFAIPVIVGATSSSPPSSLQLGFSPGTLTSASAGIPVYSTGDSLWLLSTSNSFALVQLFSAKGVLVASKTVAPSTAFELYKFLPSDSGGDWTLRFTYSNSSSLNLLVPFVNPSLDGIGVNLSNFSMTSGMLKMMFDITPGRAFNFQAMLGSSDLNSSIQIPIPTSIGSGAVLLSSSKGAENANILGSIANPFTFWFDLDYSYSYAGNVSGELISRQINTISSSSGFFANSSSSNSLILTNNTDPRPGTYTLESFFESSRGLSVEQSTVLILKNGTWVSTGASSFSPISTPSFAESESLLQSSANWPSDLYLIYNDAGVETYSLLPLNLNETRIDVVLGSDSLVGQSNPQGARSFGVFSYLNYTLSPNPNILTYNVYNGSIFIIGKNFPINLQINPNFGTERLPPMQVDVASPLSVNQASIPLGRLNIQVTNNSSPVVAARVVAVSQFGAKVSAISNANGIAVFYLPDGTYNVTVGGAGFSVTKSSNVTAGLVSTLRFAFSSTTTASYFPVLLASLLIAGFVLNVWLWLVKPRRDRYY